MTVKYEYKYILTVTIAETKGVLMRAKKIQLKKKGRTFHSRRDAARYLLKTTKLSQSDIARKLQISQACVCQCANGY